MKAMDIEMIKVNYLNFTESLKSVVLGTIDDEENLLFPMLPL